MNLGIFYCELTQQGYPKNSNFSSLVFRDALITEKCFYFLKKVFAEFLIIVFNPNELFMGFSLLISGISGNAPLFMIRSGKFIISTVS